MSNEELSESFSMISNAYFSISNFKKAYEFACYAVDKNYRNLEAHVFFAVSLFELKRKQEALTAMKRARGVRDTIVSSAEMIIRNSSDSNERRSAFLEAKVAYSLVDFMTRVFAGL